MIEVKAVVVFLLMSHSSAIHSSAITALRKYRNTGRDHVMAAVEFRGVYSSCDLLKGHNYMAMDHGRS